MLEALAVGRRGHIEQDFQEGGRSRWSRIAQELHGEAEHQLNALEKRCRSGRAGDLRPY
jgi:hypothetical protein